MLSACACLFWVQAVCTTRIAIGAIDYGRLADAAAVTDGFTCRSLGDRLHHARLYPNLVRIGMKRASHDAQLQYVHIRHVNRTLLALSAVTNLLGAPQHLVVAQHDKYYPSPSLPKPVIIKRN